MITNVKGEFRNFQASLSSNGENFDGANASATIDVASIYTNNDDRDGHLKSGDFFDAEQFPQITFESTAFKKYDDENGQLKGNLTIKGVTKEISLEVEFGGISKDPWGKCLILNLFRLKLQDLVLVVTFVKLHYVFSLHLRIQRLKLYLIAHL